VKLKVLASGSSGNCYLLITSKSRILLECGIRFREIQKKLDFDMNIDGCLVSHSHGDHSKSVKDILKHGITTYMSQGCTDDLCLSHYRLYPISSNKQFKINELIILPFDAEHDVNEPLGFLIYDTITKEKLVFATDTYYLKYKFPGVNYYLVECNYSKDILEENIAQGVINPAMRKRLLNAHFSLENLIKFFKEVDLTECRKIVLIHLSSNNSSLDFSEVIQQETGIDTEIAVNQEIQLDLYPF